MTVGRFMYVEYTRLPIAPKTTNDETVKFVGCRMSMNFPGALLHAEGTPKIYQADEYIVVVYSKLSVIATILELPSLSAL
jgi:hypothetical protein